jgi:cell division protein FtsL
LSVPAGVAPSVPPRRRRAGRLRPPPPAASPPAAAPRPVSTARRRRHHLGFVLFAAVVVGVLVVGLVAVNALVAQSSFRTDDLRQRVDRLSRRYTLLEVEAARLSAPDRVAEWAGRHGLAPPADGDLHILRVPGRQRPTPEPSETWLDPARLALKPILEGGG